MRALTAGIFAACFIVSSAIADACKLGRIASLDFTDEGGIVLPVTLEGKSASMAVDTGAIASAIDPVVAANLHVIEQRIPEGFVFDAQGEQFQYVATIHNFGIGELRADRVKMLVWPSSISREGRIAGLLGVEILSNYDVDLDFAAHKLNLFSPDHCPGKVVYWTSGNVAVIPMHVLRSGHMIVPVSIDGHPVDALLDTGASYSLLSDTFANDVFGLTPQSPGMTKVGEDKGVVSVAVYRHTFKSLSLEGLTISNPSLLIREDLIKYSMTQAPHLGSRLSSASTTNGHTDLTIGMAELRHFHLYIAYREQKLYITPVSAPDAPAAAAATTTSSTPAASH